ncbi:MAG: alpha/beta hydrolase, partial [Paracoccaceae bacterium]|nr:alpha/beta hydrolase [Paracoccaceae bacterium]
MWTDRDFENMPYIPGGAGIPDQWETDARSYREVEHAIGRARLNQSYGPAERQALDLFLPAGKPEGLVVFVHGGYWIRFDRSYSSHLARGAQQRGWAVAIPSYTLAPQARISEITSEIACALTHAAGLVAGPIVVTGHSAGG